MAAPTTAARVKKTLANPEPSTHGPLRQTTLDGQPSLSGHCGHRPIFIAQRSVANDPGCVKTLRGITAPGILSPTIVRRAKKAKIRLPLGITTKSDFVFAQPRPKGDIEPIVKAFKIIRRSGAE